MENASKALIIAGAILISILIISLGVIIYQQAAGVINNNSMSELEVTQFNEPFEAYVGKNVRGANVNALISKVTSSNSTYQGDDSKMVTITGDVTVTPKKTTDADGTKYKVVKAETGKTYDVSVTTRTSGGLVSVINVTANK